MNDDIITRILAAAERLAPLYPPPAELDAKTRKSADAALDGIVLAYYQGNHRLQVGRHNTDWHASGEHKELHSHVYGTGFIRHLAVAYHVTREEKYAEAARDYYTEFISAWPVEQVGENEAVDSTLCLSGRNAGWAQSLSLLAPSEVFDERLLRRIVDFISGQLEFLIPNIKPVINWRVFEARSQLKCSLYLAFVDQAPRWQKHAVRILNDAWHRQFLPDGVHYECNPIYHGGMAGTFLDFFRLGRLMPELGLCMELDRFKPMYDFSLACTKPNGYLCGIHDSQSEFVGHLRDGVHTEGHKAVDKRKEWEEFHREFDLPLEYPQTSQIFPYAGFAFMRTDWDEDALWMSFDATRWGSGHCHLSRNATQLHAHRQSMVIDPGWLDYGATDWGFYGKSTRAHSTCSLNRLNQSSTNPDRFEHHGAPGYDAVLSVYDGGYWDSVLAWGFTHADRGLWAEHGRILFRVEDRFALVADSMFRLPRNPEDPDDDRPSFECTWQLAPSAEIALDPEGNRVVAQWRDAGLLLLTPIRPDNSVYEVHEGETHPLRGWVPGEGEHQPAPQVVITTPRMTRQHDYCVSVLVPYAGRGTPNVSVEAKSPMGQIGHVRLCWEDGTEDAIYWACNFNMMIGKWPDFDTDGSLVHLRKDADGTVIGGCCVDGTYFEPFTEQTRQRPETFVIEPMV